MMRHLRIGIACTLLGVSLNVFALTFPLPLDGSTIVGTTQTVSAITGDTLSSLGRRYSLGIVELIEANPTLHLDQSYGPDQKVLLPTSFILPNAPHKGLVINLAELRLYFYVPHTREVRTFPIGIGRQGWDTPLGETYIAAKMADPTWVVPETIKADRLKDGIVLPDSVPPGPENPLGPFKFMTGLPGYLIHGSNDPNGIGRRSSSGCIRMQPEAIESIFHLVPVNLPVIIVDEPVKTGWLGNELYIESHIPLEDDPEDDLDVLIQHTHELINRVIKDRPAEVDWALADKVTEEHLGYPIKIGTGTGPMPLIRVFLNPGAPPGKAGNQVHARQKGPNQGHKKKTKRRFGLF